MGKQITIDVEIDTDVFEKFKFIAAKHNRSVEEELSIAIDEEFRKIIKSQKLPKTE